MSTPQLATMVKSRKNNGILRKVVADAQQECKRQKEVEQDKMKPEEVYEYLASQKAIFAEVPDKAAAYTAFENYYDRKLWHQLTVRLQQYVQREDVIKNGTELQQLYDNFIVDFQDKINQLSLVQIALFVVKSISNATVAVEFLEKVSSKVKDHIQPYALTLSEIAQFKLNTGNLTACKAAIEEAQAQLDKIAGVEPTIHASFYRVSANYDKATANFNSYYKNALLYLACVPLDSIPVQEQLQRAHDLGLAALLAESIYNFGELLTHNILKSLVGTEFEWLKDLLAAFNNGNLETFERLQPQILSQADLASHKEMLNLKMSLMSLIEMVFRREAGERGVSFDQIANQLRIPRNQVELLVMKAMALQLIRGNLDEVEGLVQVKWVQPRVLDLTQIKSLADRLDTWNTTVKDTILNIQTQTPDLFVR